MHKIIYRMFLMTGGSCKHMKSASCDEIPSEFRANWADTNQACVRTKAINSPEVFVIISK
jgi:hypothetical protein